jgi:hypothetical protein
LQDDEGIHFFLPFKIYLIHLPPFWFIYSVNN